MFETVRNWCTKRLVLVVWSDSPCLNMDNPLVAEAWDHVKNHLAQTHGQKGISFPTSCLPSPLLKKRAAFHQAPINGDQITFWSFLTVKVAKMSLYFLVPGLDPTDLAQECVAHTSTRTGTLRRDICSDCANPIQEGTGHKVNGWAIYLRLNCYCSLASIALAGCAVANHCKETYP